MHGWASLGKPDFATCGKLFYRLPAEMREGMNRSEEKVLIWTLFLSWTSAFHSGRSTTIASFSETWLGQRFSRSRWTVGRALQRLEALVLVKRIRRNPRKDGTYQTNLIALCAKLTAMLGIKTTQVREKSPWSIDAPQEVGNGYKQGKAAPFLSPPLAPSREEEELWRSEIAGNVEKAKASFLTLINRAKASAIPA